MTDNYLPKLLRKILDVANKEVSKAEITTEIKATYVIPGPAAAAGTTITT